MNHNGYRSKWHDEDPTIYPLKISRKKVLIELEVDATVTDYNSHQIVLTHPSMDGSLVFDVEGLEQAEDTLDELQMEVEAQFDLEEEQTKVPEKPKSVEPGKVNPFPQSQFYYAPPRPDPKPQPKPEPTPELKPEPKTVNIPPQSHNTPHVKRPDFDPETNPIMSIVTDIGEICDLMTKISPKLFKKK